MSDLANKAFVEHFRCPEELVRFSTSVQPFAPPGFFGLGPKVVGYGRYSRAGMRHLNGSPLPDVLPEVRLGSGTVHLPFNPTEVLGNLRYERYMPSRKTFFHPAVQQGYYSVRDYLPDGLRRWMQRLSYAGWEQVRFPRWPVDRTVEELLEALWVCLLKARPEKEIPFIWFWPDGFPGAAIMTHDVETTEGLKRCLPLMDTDEHFSIPAAFQIVPEQRYTATEALRTQMRRRGFEVNVHDLNHDGMLFSDRTTFERRARRINQSLREFGSEGFRSGMMYRNLDWLDVLAVRYDMSVPNVAHLEPQQGGCCTVMPFFAGDILELPLTTTQDYAMRYVLREESIDLWKTQVGMILEKHGLASFIVHPDYLDTDQAQKTYRSLLTYLSQLRAHGILWIAPPGEINQWWRQRGRMRLVREANGWRPMGTGSERARVAYASLSGGKLVYRLEPNREPIHSDDCTAAPVSSNADLCLVPLS